MKPGIDFGHHKLFFFFLVLFFVVAAIDILNVDRVCYEAVCNLAAPVSGGPCATFYDMPIWEVYLSLTILAALYRLHDEVRTTNRHLSSHRN